MLDGLRRARPRPDRAVAEGRAGGQRRARASASAVPTRTRRTSAGVDCLLAFDLLVAASDTHRVGADAPTAPSSSAPLAPTPTGAMVAHPDDALPRARQPSPPGSARCHATSSTVYPNAAALSRRAVRRRDDGQHPPARRRRAGRRGRRVAGGDRAGDRAQRRRRRTQPWPPSAGGAAGSSTRRGRAGGGPHRRRLPETLDELDRAPRPPTSSTTSRRRYATPLPRARRASPGRRARRRPGEPLFTEAVARNLHKLMAYKDEYEVARLLLLPEARAQAYEAVGGRRHQGHVAPPPADAAGARHEGQDAARAGGRSRCSGALRPVEAGARHARRPVPLGRGAPRRAGDDPRVRGAARHGSSTGLDADNLRRGRRASPSLPDQVRGYEHLKLHRAEAYRAELADSLRAFP